MGGQADNMDTPVQRHRPASATPTYSENVSAPKLSSEEDTKREWIVRVQPPLRRAQGAVSVGEDETTATPHVDASSPKPSSEEEAKRAWLARLDPPAPPVQGDQGGGPVGKEETTPKHVSDDGSPSKPSSEEEAKRVWLARLDPPPPVRGLRGDVPVGRTESTPTSLPDNAPLKPSSEEEAKRAWLARLEQPERGPPGDVPVGRTESTTTALPDTAPSKPSSEEEAKRVWLARLDPPVRGPRGDAPVGRTESTPISISDTAPSKPSSEEEAKRAWLARLDVRGPRSDVPVDRTESTPTSLPDNAPSKPSSEEEAKRAWLARLEQPERGPQGVAPVSNDSPPFPSPEEEAKTAWLARRDPSARSSQQFQSPQGVAVGYEEITEPCFLEDEPPKRLSEEEAKRAWLARLDTPLWDSQGRRVGREGITQTCYPDEAPPRPFTEEERRAWYASIGRPLWDAEDYVPERRGGARSENFPTDAPPKQSSDGEARFTSHLPAASTTDNSRHDDVHCAATAAPEVESRSETIHEQAARHASLALQQERTRAAEGKGTHSPSSSAPSLLQADVNEASGWLGDLEASAVMDRIKAKKTHRSDQPVRAADAVAMPAARVLHGEHEVEVAHRSSVLEAPGRPACRPSEQEAKEAWLARLEVRAPADGRVAAKSEANEEYVFWLDTETFGAREMSAGVSMNAADGPAPEDENAYQAYLSPTDSS
ncbi:hypothetical protein AB1Y20_013938 [Prymnesium parvum]|uniref:Uncharacterized protein n=1 Tax=Prymnesium parvum TaxID=97485 RepID=A0AB34IEL3_PRYPA